MAIDAYVGLPGSGKSYGVVEHVILPSIRERRRVVTNIPLVMDRVYQAYPHANVLQLQAEQFADPGWVDVIQPGDVVVLDELWRVWPAGLKANQADERHKQLLAEHRHMVDSEGRSMRIVLVTQDLAQVAAWVRALVETTYQTRKLSALGSRKKYLVNIYNGAVTGQRPPKSQLLRSIPGRYRPEVYQFYQSATHSKTGMVGDESKADGRGSLLRSPAFLGGLFGGSLIVVWGVSAAIRGLDPEHSTIINREAMRTPAAEAGPPPRPVLPVPVAAAPAPVPVAVPAAKPAKPAEPTLSSRWRLAGIIQQGERALIIAVDANGRHRHVPQEACTLIAGTPDWRCLVDGAVVTTWSGSPSAVLGSGYAKGSVSGSSERSEDGPTPN